MTRLRTRLGLSLPLAALLGAAVSLPAAPAGGDEKKAPAAPDPLPDGARLRLGSAHFRHGAGVTKIFTLPDGKRLLTIAQDARARMWDLATQKELFQIALTPQPYGGLCFSLAPDGKTLAAAAVNERILRTWNLADGKETLTFAALPANQNFIDLEYSTDGKLLVSSHQDRVFRIWDAATAKELRQIGQPNIPNVATPFYGRVRFTPDDKALAVIEDWSVRLLDAEDGKELRWFGGHTAPVTNLSYSPDGKRLATIAGDRVARVWDAATGKAVAKLPLPLGGGTDLAFANGGKTLAVSCGGDRTVRFFDIDAAKQTSQVDLGPGLGAPTLALALDGQTLYVSSNEPLLHAYDVASGKELFPVTGHPGGTQALAWSPDGKLVATSGAVDRSIILWDAASGKIQRHLPALDPSWSTTYVQFAPDSKTLLSYGTDRTIRTWEVAEGKELRSFMTSPLAPNALAVSRDGKRAAVAAADHKVRVWDVADEKELHVLEVKPAAGRPGYFFYRLSFAPDNRTLLVHSPNERVTRRFDAVTGKALGEVTGIALIGLTANQPGDDRTNVVLQGLGVNLIESATGKVRQTLTVPPPPPVPGAPPRPFVGTIAGVIAPDGRTVATVTADGVLHLWDAASGKTLVERRDLPFNSRLLAFAPDGKSLASAGNDVGALLWEVPGPTAEGRLAIRDLTPEALADLWKDLAGDDASRAWQAILSLAAAPKVALPFVQKQLKPGTPLDAKAIAKLIADLDSEKFEERESATEGLVRAGKAAEEAVKKALENKPSAEAKQRLELVVSKLSGSLGPNLEEVRAARIVELLEKVGTPQAEKILEEIVKGGDGLLAAEARPALEALKARNAAP